MRLLDATCYAFAILFYVNTWTGLLPTIEVKIYL